MATLNTNLRIPVRLAWGEIDAVLDRMGKAGSATSSEPERWILKGFMSTEAFDADNQVVEQDGIDWGPFDSRGIITDGHPARPDNIVGQKIVREPRTYKGIKGTWLECELLQDMPRAPGLWKAHRALCKGPTGRGLGFSVEGWATEIDGHRITKSVVETVAIDIQPKNPLTYAMPIAASMSAYLGSAPDAQYPALMKALALASDPRARQILQVTEGLPIENIAAAQLMSRWPDMPWNEALKRARISIFGAKP